MPDLDGPASILGVDPVLFEDGAKGDARRGGRLGLHQEQRVGFKQCPQVFKADGALFLVVVYRGQIGGAGEMVTLEIAKELQLALQVVASRRCHAFGFQLGAEVVQLVVGRRDNDGVRVHVDGP